MNTLGWYSLVVVAFFIAIFFKKIIENDNFEIRLGSAFIALIKIPIFVFIIKFLSGS